MHQLQGHLCCVDATIIGKAQEQALCFQVSKSGLLPFFVEKNCFSEKLKKIRIRVLSFRTGSAQGSDINFNFSA